MMIKITYVMAIALLLTGCASAPYSHKTTSGCSVSYLDKTWARANVQSMKWTGACKEGKTTGNGVLEIIRNDGQPMRYEGNMLAGYLSHGGYPPAIYIDGAQRKVGQFSFFGFESGQVYENGKLLFDGKVVGLDPVLGYYSGAWKVGKVYFPNGRYIDGELDTSTEGFDSNGKGVKRGTYNESYGAVIHWIEGGKVYKSEQDWSSAILKRTKLDNQLTQTFAALDKSAVQTMSSSNEKKRLYYAENRDIQANKIQLLDNMSSQCAAKSICIFGDLLSSRRNKEYAVWAKHDKDFREMQASFESAARLDNAVGVLLDSGVLGAEYTNAFRAGMEKHQTISNLVNQISTSSKNAGELAPYISQLYKLINE